MFAIAGVTGNTGSVVAETLLAAKAPIRVIVRDAAKGAAWKARGAEVAIADLGDVAALTAAFAGVQGAYVLLPPRPTSTAPLADNHAVADAIAAAVAAAKVPHVVLLSSVGAQHPSGTGPIATVHYAEQVLAKVTTWTAVRAASRAARPTLAAARRSPRRAACARCSPRRAPTPRRAGGSAGSGSPRGSSG